VAGCERVVHAYGWCKTHYNRYRRYGDVRGDWRPGDKWWPGLPGNPWAGQRTCPECHTHRWTMPRDGTWTDERWVCVAPEHTTRFFKVAL
jgi:hypothetical protein